MSKITIELDDHRMTIEGHETRDLVPDHALGMIYDRDEKIKKLQAELEDRDEKIKELRADMDQRSDRDEKIRELRELRADMDHYRSVVLGRIGRPEIGLTPEQYDMIKAVVP